MSMVAAPAPRAGMSRSLFAVANLLGVAAFLAPFLGSAAPSGEAGARAADAPILLALLAPLVLAVAVSQVRSGRADARSVALLGVLAGLNAALRIPGSLGGANLMFVLPVLCGYAFGPGFGFLLGVSSMAISAVATGGVGPWLPFQMWAMGWFGGGAGLLRRFPLRHGGAAEVVALAAYAWVAALLFGALTNLWFWPFVAGPSEAVSWEPGIGAGEALVRYWRFYLLTSLAWDSARSIVTAALVALCARPVLLLLRRFGRRFAPVSYAATMEAPWQRS